MSSPDELLLERLGILGQKLRRVSDDRVIQSSSGG
jgi:hypothetical protein